MPSKRDYSTETSACTVEDFVFNLRDSREKLGKRIDGCRNQNTVSKTHGRITRKVFQQF